MNIDIDDLPVLNIELSHLEARIGLIKDPFFRSGWKGHRVKWYPLNKTYDRWYNSYKPNQTNSNRLAYFLNEVNGVLTGGYCALLEFLKIGPNQVKPIVTNGIRIHMGADGKRGPYPEPVLQQFFKWFYEKLDFSKPTESPQEQAEKPGSRLSQGKRLKEKDPIRLAFDKVIHAHHDLFMFRMQLFKEDGQNLRIEREEIQQKRESDYLATRLYGKEVIDIDFIANGDYFDRERREWAGYGKAWAVERWLNQGKTLLTELEKAIAKYNRLIEEVGETKRKRAAKALADLAEEIGQETTQFKTAKAKELHPEPLNRPKDIPGQERGMYAGTDDKVKRFHKLRKDGMPQTEALKQIEKEFKKGLDIRTYHRHCYRVTGEEPIPPD